MAVAVTGTVAVGDGAGRPQLALVSATVRGTIAVEITATAISPTVVAIVVSTFTRDMVGERGGFGSVVSFCGARRASGVIVAFGSASVAAELAV
jgi:hypothetical protein